jgi:hypothetical protein
MAYGDDQVSQNPGARFGSVALGAGAYFLGGLIPILLVAAAIFAVKKLFPRLSEPAALFASLSAGQLLWLLFGAIVAPAMWAMVAADLAIGGVLLAWFLARPSVVPTALIMLFELVGLGVNLWALNDASFADPVGKALILHMLLRLAILASGVWYLLKRNETPVAAEIFE